MKKLIGIFSHIRGGITQKGGKRTLDLSPSRLPKGGLRHREVISRG